MLTLIKNFQDESKTQKKINVKKIISLKEVINKPIEEIKIQISKIDEINKLSSFNIKEGKTKVVIEISENNKTFTFELKDKRKIDLKLINSLDFKENISIR